MKRLFLVAAALGLGAGIGCGSSPGEGALADAAGGDQTVDAANTADAAASGDSAVGSGADAGTVASGTFRVVTYNVAGLPVGISGSNPAANTVQISPLLNAYDLVLVQEDFTYHDDLVSLLQHPYLSTPMPVGGLTVNDGLNRFADFAFASFQRVKWDDCNGYVTAANDCLAPKGFSFAVHTLAPGAELHVYNLHADAGRSSGDISTRAKQVAQLVAFIHANSAGAAVLVAGDTNMKPSDDAATLQALLDGASLVDACQSLGCANPETIDRIMIRSSATLNIAATGWERDLSFVDSNGEPLSDHEAIGVDLEWSLAAP